MPHGKIISLSFWLSDMTNQEEVILRKSWEWIVTTQHSYNLMSSLAIKILTVKSTVLRFQFSGILIMCSPKSWCPSTELCNVLAQKNVITKFILISASITPSNISSTSCYYFTLFYLLCCIKKNGAGTVFHLVPPISGHLWRYLCHFNHFLSSSLITCPVFSWSDV